MDSKFFLLSCKLFSIREILPTSSTSSTNDKSYSIKKSWIQCFQQYKQYIMFDKVIWYQCDKLRVIHTTFNGVYKRMILLSASNLNSAKIYNQIEHTGWAKKMSNFETLKRDHFKPIGYSVICVHIYLMYSFFLVIYMVSQSNQETFFKTILKLYYLFQFIFPPFAAH